MKKMFMLLSAGALFAASAATLSTTSGTTFVGLTAGDAFSASVAAAEGGKYYWYSADAQSGTNMSLAANYYGGACGRPNQFVEAETSIALAVDAENLLYRAAEGSASAFSSPSFTQVDLGDGGLYIDTLIKFEQCRDEADIADDAGKLAVWLNSTSNLVITAGKYSGETFATNNYTAAALGETLCSTFNPDAWYRLTVKAVNSNNKVLFNVYIDGQLVTALDGGPITFFPSLQPSSLTLSALAFQGEGAVDDISFTEELPNFLFVGVAQIGDTYYATLDEALAAVNVGDTIVLIADPGVTSVTLPKTGIALSDPNGYLSTVTGPNGQEVTASENTYTLPLTAVNPVTGETENYENAFIGGTAEWNSSANWDTSTTPFITTTYSPALVNGKTASTSTAIDGWTLRVGAYNGAAVTWAGGITKIQAGSAGCWLTADETSSITIASFAGKQLEGSDAYPFKLYSANAGGITWSAGLTSASNTSLPFWYYLKGTGTVVYGGGITVANAQVIKQADVTLSGNAKSVQSKTLVSFGSGTTKTFTADAAIKVKNSSDEVVRTVNLSSVNSTGTTTLTTDNAVGMCELVQTTTGILLFWVDGDPSDIKEYKPSININFTHSGSGLTAATDVGLAGYEVPGTSWNNFAGSNGTYSNVNAIDSTGAASAMSGVSVAVSGTRGSYSCSGLTSADNPLHGYIDENGTYPTPTVTVSGIPYYKYRVIVYHSTDTAGVPFGYDTLNGTNYTYVNDALAEGTTAWGNSGAKDSANAISEGGNVLVTEALSGSTLTVVGHRAGGVSNARGCIAAIQIVEVKPEAGEGDLIIEVSGATTYTVNEAKTLSGTVYVIGQGTLTLDGSAKISSATIDVGPGVTMNVNADRLDGTTFTGAGTVVYDGSQPLTTKGFDNSSGWVGTVWVKNIGDPSRGEATNLKVNTCLGSNTADASGNDLNKWGNANSFVKFTNVRAYMAAANVPWTLILEDDSTNYAWYNNEGWTARTITIAGLKGSGTFWDINDGGCRPFLNFTDASQFSGSIKALGKQVFLNGAGNGNATDLSSGRIVVPADQVLTVAADKTWYTRNGLVVAGTLNVNGDLESESTTSAVSGTGTVVFTGKLPSPTGDTWWKNSAWDGTVQVKNAAFTGVSGVTTYLEVNKYGNDGSVLELNNCSGWLPVGNTSGDNVCAVPLKVTGTLNINNGYSGRQFTINKLLGDGAIYADSNGATVTIQVLNADGFTGKVQLNSKRVVFGETIPGTFTSGQIYVGSDFTFTVPNENAAWYGTGGILLDGELKANALSNFGGGTTITTTDNGVLTLVTNSNADDMNVDYARIQGTGTLRLEGSAYRCISTNNFPTAMTVDNRLTAGFLHRIPGLEITIGSLAGDGYLRSDWGGSAGDRDLRILQAKDTTWSGNFWASNPHRFRSLIVAPGATTSGTLTISATHVAAESTGLAVESGAAVNLTGTWVGATTVAGTFGGTGTLTGNLTFNAGSTFKAFAADENGLSVSGSITYPASGTVTVDVSALGAPAAKVVLLTAASESDIDLSKFALADGTNRKYKLAKEGATLVLKGARKGVFIGVY